MKFIRKPPAKVEAEPVVAERVVMQTVTDPALAERVAGVEAAIKTVRGEVALAAMDATPKSLRCKFKWNTRAIESFTAIDESGAVVARGSVLRDEMGYLTEIVVTRKEH